MLNISTECLKARAMHIQTEVSSRKESRTSDATAPYKKRLVEFGNYGKDLSNYFHPSSPPPLRDLLKFS